MKGKVFRVHVGSDEAGLQRCCVWWDEGVCVKKTRGAGGLREE